MLPTSSIKLHSPSCVDVAIKSVVVTVTPFLCKAQMSSTLPLQVWASGPIALVIPALVLLSRKIVGIPKGVEVASLNRLICDSDIKLQALRDGHWSLSINR